MSLDEEREPLQLVGTVIASGRYRIVGELATVDRRTIYDAESLEQHVRVRLVVVRADGTPTSQRVRDAQRLRALKARTLVSVLDVGKLDTGDVYVATEYVDGTTVRALAGGKRLEPRRTLVIIRQVLEALTAAHSVGAIHGDVKPESVVVMPGFGDPRVKLIDFGVAALTGPTCAGDPKYGAPESALGPLDRRADLYSTGAVLFELLTGHPPFFADDPSALRRLHAYAPRQTLKQRVPDLDSADPLEDIVATAMEKDRGRRYPSAVDMINAIDPVIGALDVAAIRPVPASNERRRVPHDSLLVLAKDLIHAPQASPLPSEPLMPVNVTRQVPELPWSTRAKGAVRRLAGALGLKKGAERPR